METPETGSERWKNRAHGYRKLGALKHWGDTGFASIAATLTVCIASHRTRACGVVTRAGERGLPATTA